MKKPTTKASSPILSSTPSQPNLKTKDLVLIKNEITSSISLPLTTPSNPFSSNKTYVSKYKNYLSDTFNSKSYCLISSYIKYNKHLLLHTNNFHQVIKDISTVIRKLTMNEMEIALYTLYIDNLILKRQKTLSLTNLFLYIGILTKYHSTLSSEQYIRYFKRNDIDLFENYTKWRSQQSENIFSLKIINQRYKMLKKLNHSFDKKYYINYNKLVDQILTVDNEDISINEKEEEDKFNINHNTLNTNSCSGKNCTKKEETYFDNKEELNYFDSNFNMKGYEDSNIIDNLQFTEEFISDCDDLLNFEHQQ